MKLLLTSAGLCNDAITDELARLAGRPLSELSIIHIPTAANLQSDDKSWIIDDLNNIKRQSFKSIDILDIAGVDRETAHTRMLSANIISFGGGNEQYLARVFAEKEIGSFLKEALKERVYMGTSAGSMVMGEFLPYELLKIVYPEESFNETLANPLRFVNFSFIPHLNSKWFPHNRKENLENLRNKLIHTTYATDDATAISVTEGEITIIGTGDYWIKE